MIKLTVLGDPTRSLIQVGEESELVYSSITGLVKDGCVRMLESYVGLEVHTTSGSDHRQSHGLLRGCGSHPVPRQ